jgi:predicted ATPase
VEVFELTGASAIHRRLQAVAARGLTRFVGRQHELETLRQALERAATGHGQIAAIVGEAGVGKSRLVYEFTQADVPRTWLILEGASVSYGKATPYFPVLDLLRRYMHLEERDETRTIRAKVTGHVLTLDVALQDIIPALLALLDVAPDDSPFLQLDPAQRRQRTLEALKRLLLRESQVQPLLLVFEDLHWIDAETQALLDNLVGSLPTARLLLLVNYRPEYQHGWGSKTYYAQLRLDPLPPASAAEVLAALLGDDPSLVPLTQLLMARTEGNPFFLEESVRTLIEAGILVGERGAYQLARALPTIQVPATVQAVLAARIDRLPPEEKTLLQTAAAIGTEVPVPLLQAIAELPEAALHRGLAHLQDAEFLYETRLFPEQVCTFKHALTHEVAYGSLLYERRRVLHARIAETLEEMAGDRVAEQIERLAHHALRGEAWDKALTYCRQAGEKAMARSAHREAVEYFEQALNALSHLPETRDMREQAIDLRLALRAAFGPIGDYRRMLACLHEAEALATALDDSRRLAQVLSPLSLHSCIAGEYEQALVAAWRALELALATGEIVQQAGAHQFLCRAYYHQGNYRQAIDCITQAVAALEGMPLHERFGGIFLPAVQYRCWLTWCHAELGTFAAGRILGEEGLRIAEAVGHPASLMTAYNGLGLLILHQGDLPRAIPLLERAVSIGQDTGLLALSALYAEPLGAAYVLGGCVADALPLLTQTLEQLTALERVDFQARCSLSLGEAHMLAGHLEDAHTLAERALTHTRAYKERGNEAYALRLLGAIAAHRDPLDVAQAEAHYQQALTLAAELGMCPLQSHCHLGLGALYARIEQREQARAELSTAIALYRTMEMTFWLPQAETALAQVEAR